MFVKSLALLFYNVFACFSVLLCCRSLTSKCCKRWKRRKESLPVRSSAQTHDQAHLQLSVWTRIENTAIERMSCYRAHPCIPKIPALPQVIAFLAAPQDIRGLCVIKRRPCNQVHLLFPNNIYFPINMTTCVNFQTYVFQTPLKAETLYILPLKPLICYLFIQCLFLV